MYLSIVIPAYNEERRIVKTLMAIDSYFKNINSQVYAREFIAKNNFDYEILVVSDGSTDKTVEVVKNLKINNLSIINNKKNMGKGYVVRQGLLAGRGKYRLFTDADNATSIDQLEKFIPYLKDYDIIIASRSLKESVTPVPQPFYRKILGDIYRLLAKNMVGLKNIKDSQCGFKLFNERVIKNILPKCEINGLSFDVEILIVAQKLGYKIKEIPVTWIDVKGSKVTFSRMQRSIFELLNIKWNLLKNKYKPS